MYLYNLTLKQATAITHAVVGEFSGRRGDRKRHQYEIALAKGKILEIVRADEATGKIHSIISVNVFGIIRSLAAFRLTGSVKDYIAIGSDSGRLVILEYLPQKKKFDKVHQETFGRTGMRRLVPGQYLASDSKGRAIMVASLEKQKLVYQLNRDTQANLTISSPLEAHKANTYVFAMVNIDVGYDNPLFACLELDYEDADEDPTGEAAKNAKQCLTYYELDLGLNHVVRKYSEPLEEYANYLIPVPGGDDGPSGIIVCFENYVTYKNFGDQTDITCMIPRRKGETDIKERGIMIECSACYKYISENGTKSFFLLVQTELGDLFKLELDVVEMVERDRSVKKIIREIKMTYFETVPLASQICLIPQTRRHIDGGFLFVAAQAGNHLLFQIEKVKDADNQYVFSSKDCTKANKDDEDSKKFLFKPREEYKNIVLIDEILSLAPVISSQPIETDIDHQFLVACGTGKNSSLRVLKHGITVSERAQSMLPSVATGVWSLKRRIDSDYDEYIVVSFINATLVLGVNESIDEIVDSGFLGTKRTIGCTQLGDDSLIQIHPDGIRHIHADKRVNEWRTPFRRQITKCALNQRQIAIALSNNEVIYFELDTTGQLNEYSERKEFNSPIACMALGEIAPTETRSLFLAVGIDQKVCVLTLDLNECMSEITRQAFSSTPESISICELGAGKDHTLQSLLYLNVGLQNGELVRTRLDRVTGDLSEPVRRYLGNEPVKLFNVYIGGRQAVLANTNRSWLLYYHQSRCNLSPLSYETLDCASSFSSKQVGEGIVAITGSTLRVICFDELGDVYNQQSCRLEATPRRFVMHSQSGNVIIILTERLPLLIQPITNGLGGNSHHHRTSKLGNNVDSQENDDSCNEDDTMLSESQLQQQRAYGDKWKSLIKLIDPRTGEELYHVNLESHQAALSIALTSFGAQQQQTVHVGVANDYKLRYQTFSSCEIHTYTISPQGNDLQLLHVTQCEDMPRAMSPILTRLAVGLGKTLRIYDLGKKKLLKKCECKTLPNFITSISVCESRLFVCDVQESVFAMKYRLQENVLNVFADDTSQRYIICSGLFDSRRIACGDKFGNLSLLELPDDVNDDPVGGARTLWANRDREAQQQKIANAATIHIGEVVTSVHRTFLTAGRADCVLYTTIFGSIGALIPFSLKEDYDLFQSIEMHMRLKNTPLAGRDHLSFRCSFFPVTNIIDGDLCERFLTLDAKTQDEIAADLDTTAAEISQAIDQLSERII